MKHYFFLFCLLSPLIPVSNAFSLERKVSSPYDFRIKTVIYNEQDTVQVDGVAGIATHIQVSPNETYLTHAFGDDGGWAFACKNNHYFIKPKEEDSDTNLTIVTDKHVYHIVLHYIGGKQEKSENGETKTVFAPTPWDLKQATLDLKYIYPDQDEAVHSKKKKEQHLQEELADPYGDGVKNFSYFMSDDPKSRDIAPTNIWDNYRFTYFRFPENGELPTIFVINQSGKESIVNTTVTGKYHNIIVAHKIASQWRIRYGDKVIGVINKGFNPVAIKNQTETISPHVVRVVKDDEE